MARDHWPAWRSALAEAHSDPAATNARKRLAYDEIFANQLALMLLRQVARRKKGVPLQGDGRLTGKLQLPYRLTGAQQRVIGEIRGDMAQDKPMLRLLQGDVGSGKTLVALLAMLEAVEAGAQAAMLAPTEILARQHHATLQRQCEAIGVSIAILTGREKGRARESVLMGLADGSIDILVGTHAIFQQHVAYQKLGLIVIDEQHRFGVSQRLLLSEKAERPPHLLAMTATPIPRTLTLTHYGEMDVSRIDEMPPGRTPIETLVISDAEAGRRDRRSWPAPCRRAARPIGSARWSRRARRSMPPRPRSGPSCFASASATDRVGLVHGRMKGPDKDAVMTSFAAGELGVLVATTVIEVGVDVPNAIADHRRGRRALRPRPAPPACAAASGAARAPAAASCCAARQLSETGRARLALMRETNDGFRIAEEDLRLRGPGEILGTRQSGEQNFRVAAPEDVAELAPIAQGDARLLLDRDGGLASERGQAARLCLYLFERDAAVGLLRSG